MKKMLHKLPVFISVLVMVASLCIGASAAAPDVGTEFDDLSYIDVVCSLGEVRFYLPEGVDPDVLQVKNGKIYNLTGSTVSLYCPLYPEYSFTADSFSSVTCVRPDQTAMELIDVTIKDTHSFPVFTVPELIISGLLLIIVVLLVWRCFR